jgi:hypothetical protein
MHTRPLFIGYVTVVLVVWVFQIRIRPVNACARSVKKEVKIQIGVFLFADGDVGYRDVDLESVTAQFNTHGMFRPVDQVYRLAQPIDTELVGHPELFVQVGIGELLPVALPSYFIINR